MRIIKKILIVTILLISADDAWAFDMDAIPAVGMNKKNDSLNYRHSIYLEGLDPGIMGSIGYDCKILKQKKYALDFSLGIGGTYLFRQVNPWTAFSLPFGININYQLSKRFHLSAGVYFVSYFNYWGLIKNSKDCQGVWNCPPDFDTFIAPRIGFSYHLERFAFELNCYKYFGFWAYDWYIPSLKIKYKL